MAHLELVYDFEQKALPEKKDIGKSPPQLECKTYGYECNFIASGEIEKILMDFRDHTMQEHHIEYPEGVLMKFISRKYGSKNLQSTTRDL